MLEVEKNDNEGPGLLEQFLFALKSPVTKAKYQRRLVVFFEFVGVEGSSMEEKMAHFIENHHNYGNQWTLNIVRRFMTLHLKRIQNKEITGSTIQNYLKSIKLFFEIADITIPMKRITRGLPKGRTYADDRIPTLEEIQKLIKYPDRRIKSIVFTMISSGIRLGAWEFLKWGHIRPIYNNDLLTAAKIIIYSGEDEEYYSFISKEAYNSLKEWMDYRENSGEIINNESWLMRDLWDTQINTGTGLISRPKKLAPNGIKRLIERALWAQGLRTKLSDGKKRHPFQAVHSLRKWFKTKCEIGGMKPINVELLLSHSVGISNSYYRPTESDLLEDYLKVVDHLSIDTESRLQNEIENLQHEQENKNDSLLAKLYEKDELLKNMNMKHENDLIQMKQDIEHKLEKIMQIIDVSKI